MFCKGSIGAQFNDITFVLVWFTTRILYVIPTVWKSILRGSGGSYRNLIVGLLVILTVMHIYWGYLMTKKIYRMVAKMFNKEK